MKKYAIALLLLASPAFSAGTMKITVIYANAANTRILVDDNNGHTWYVNGATNVFLTHKLDTRDPYQVAINTVVISSVPANAAALITVLQSGSFNVP